MTRTLNHMVANAFDDLATMLPTSRKGFADASWLWRTNNVLQLSDDQLRAALVGDLYSLNVMPQSPEAITVPFLCRFLSDPEESRIRAFIASDPEFNEIVMVEQNVVAIRGDMIAQAMKVAAFY